MFQGSMVALVTPMQNDGAIDKKSLHDLVEWHIASRTDAIIVAGTTGEAATLNLEEQYDLISTVVKQVAKRVPVIAGTGTNDTRNTIERTQRAQKAGADAVLIVTPYCTKPPQRGLFQHYKLVAENSSLPIILYNVPGRTACDLLPETVAQLSRIKNIIGIKEATGNLERTKDILKQSEKHFEVYSGDDATALDLILQSGAKGVISVTANVAPKEMHDLCEAALRKDHVLAEKINNSLKLLHTQLFLEANPIPVKWALHEMGMIPSGIRLPLVSLDTKFHTEVREAMHTAGIKKLVEMR